MAKFYVTYKQTVELEIEGMVEAETEAEAVMKAKEGDWLESNSDDPPQKVGNITNVKVLEDTQPLKVVNDL